MRALLFSFVFASAAAAQGAMPPPPISMPGVDLPGVSIPGMNVTQAAAEEAIAAALAETRVAVEDSATIEVLEAIRAGFADSAEPGPEAEAAPATAPRRVRTQTQTYPTLFEGYGFQGDGFPERSTIVGTVVAAGSVRLCRQGRPPVSRWLQVRLTGMPEGIPPVHITVAVQCDEWAASHYLGRRVRIDAIKSAPEQEIRMARRDLPDSDSPLYLADPTRVVVE